jgi:hypothetical protein
VAERAEPICGDAHHVLRGRLASAVLNVVASRPFCRQLVPWASGRVLLGLMRLGWATPGILIPTIIRRTRFKTRLGQRKSRLRWLPRIRAARPHRLPAQVQPQAFTQLTETLRAFERSAPERAR